VLAMMNRECPQNVMEYMRILDMMGVYGKDIVEMFWDECRGNLEIMIRTLTSVKCPERKKSG